MTNLATSAHLACLSPTCEEICQRRDGDIGKEHYVYLLRIYISRRSLQQWAFAVKRMECSRNKKEKDDSELM